MAIITLARATELVPNWNTADNAVMTDLVDAASDFVEKYCNRTFAVTSYDELYDGTGAQNLLLNQWPVTAIARVMYNPINAFQVRMTDQDASRAVFALSSTALTLTKVKAGITTTTSLTLASYATLGDLQSAVNALGGGWAALALGVYSGFPVADLKAPQGGNDCRWQGAGYLRLHAYALPAFDYNPDLGEIVSPFGFARGYRNFRVVYSAGYSTVPTPVQQTCAELAVAMYLARGQNPNLQSESLGGYSYTLLADKSFASLSAVSRQALEYYRNRRIVKCSVY